MAMTYWSLTGWGFFVTLNIKARLMHTMYTIYVYIYTHTHTHILFSTLSSLSGVKYRISQVPLYQ